jgi:hypothetical protein
MDEGMPPTMYGLLRAGQRVRMFGNGFRGPLIGSSEFLQRRVVDREPLGVRCEAARSMVCVDASWRAGRDQNGTGSIGQRSCVPWGRVHGTQLGGRVARLR